MKGCFYHVSLNIWKKAQHFGLQQRYNEDQEFTLHTCMLCVVVFIPTDNVTAGFEELSDLIRETYQGEMDDQLDYFEETYIGWYHRNAERRPPLSALNLWNMFHMTFGKLPRTNIMLKDGTGVYKRKYRRVIPSFGSLLIFFELKKI